MGGGLEDNACIVLQNFQPVSDVGCVLLARLGRQFQIGAEERSPQLGNELFLRVAFVAPLRGTQNTLQDASRNRCGSTASPIPVSTSSHSG